MVLEVPRSATGGIGRISSHVLCTHGNEIFMHTLNCTKSSLEERTPMESIERSLNEYRTDVIEIY